MKRLQIALFMLALAATSSVAQAGWFSWIPGVPDDEPKRTTSYRRAEAPKRIWTPSMPAPVHAAVDGTKQFFSKTADVLTFKKSEPAARRSGMSSSYSLNRRSTPEKKSWSIIPSMFRKEETRPSSSLDDFFNQPRP